VLGFLALGLESTLPVPQLVRCVGSQSGEKVFLEIFLRQQLQTEVPVWFPGIHSHWLDRRGYFQVGYLHALFSHISALNVLMQDRLFFPASFAVAVQSMRCPSVIRGFW
jgi:hypothetical protein